MKDFMIIANRHAAKIPTLGWCWIDANNTDNNYFDYCVSVCDEQSACMLEKLQEGK